jgi:effector-binding domain-containing protein
MLDTPQIIQTSEQQTAVIRLIVPRDEIVQVMDPAIAEILSVIHDQGSAPAGPCCSFHFRRPTDTFAFEVGFPVHTSISPSGRVKMSALPATRVVRTVYHGGYEGLGNAWGEFLLWIENAGLATQDCLWECYTSGPESSPDPGQWCTELNRPLTA